MKKVFLPLFSLCLLLAGCETQEIEKPDLVDAGNFLTVRIMTDKASPATKAEEEELPPDYVYGSADENKVTNIIFFFFDDKNNAKAIRMESDDPNSSKSWYLYDYQAGQSEANPIPDETVEKTLVTIPITVATGSTKADLPTQVLAVLNPSTELITKVEAEGVGPSLSDLQSYVMDFEQANTEKSKKENKVIQDLAQSGTFVMSNSVYKDNGKKVQTAPITEKNYYSRADYDAAIERKEGDQFITERAVKIYVERVLARLDLKLDLHYPDQDRTSVGTVTTGNGETLYKVVKSSTDMSTGTGTESIDIYVKFLGWTFLDTPNQSRLIKEIDVENWNSTALFGATSDERWNSVEYHRSFWAVNPETLKYKVGPLNKKDAGVSAGSPNGSTWTKDNLFASHELYPMPKGGESVKGYMQENAAPFKNTLGAPETPTKVLIAAQLTDKEGAPIELIEWGGQRYTRYGIQILLANTLTNLYKKSDSGNDYVRVEPEDLALTKERDEENDKTVTYATLSDKGKQATWYVKKKSENTFDYCSDAEAYIRTQTDLQIGEATIRYWEGGFTYYYFAVRHLGEKNGEEESPAYYGIVRNHVYEATVTSLQGFGAPDYDSGDTYPDDYLMSAQVKILSWRVVRQDYDLTW